MDKNSRLALIAKSHGIRLVRDASSLIDSAGYAILEEYKARSLGTTSLAASLHPETPMTICSCCKGKDGRWRFICRCGMQATAARTATGCPRCGIPWRFEQGVKRR